MLLFRTILFFTLLALAQTGNIRKTPKHSSKTRSLQQTGVVTNVPGRQNPRTPNPPRSGETPPDAQRPNVPRSPGPTPDSTVPPNPAPILKVGDLLPTGTCNPNILTAFGLSGQNTPAIVKLDFFPMVINSCCTVADQTILYDNWVKKGTEAALDAKFKNYSEAVKSLFQVAVKVTKLASDLLLGFDNTERSPNECSLLARRILSHQIDDLQYYLTDMFDEGYAYLKKVYKGLYSAICNADVTAHFKLDKNEITYSEKFCRTYLTETFPPAMYINIHLPILMNLITTFIGNCNKNGEFKKIDFPANVIIPFDVKNVEGLNKCFQNRNFHGWMDVCLSYCEAFQINEIPALLKIDFVQYKNTVTFIANTIPKFSFEPIISISGAAGSTNTNSNASFGSGNRNSGSPPQNPAPGSANNVPPPSGTPNPSSGASNSPGSNRTRRRLRILGERNKRKLRNSRKVTKRDDQNIKTSQKSNQLRRRRLQSPLGRSGDTTQTPLPPPSSPTPSPIVPTSGTNNQPQTSNSPQTPSPMVDLMGSVIFPAFATSANFQLSALKGKVKDAGVNLGESGFFTNFKASRLRSIRRLMKIQKKEIEHMKTRKLKSADLFKAFVFVFVPFFMRI